MLASRDATRNRSALFGGECKRRPDPHDGLTGRPEPARDFTDRQPLVEGAHHAFSIVPREQVGRPTCRPLSCELHARFTALAPGRGLQPDHRPEHLDRLRFGAAREIDVADFDALDDDLLLRHCIRVDSASRALQPSAAISSTTSESPGTARLRMPASSGRSAAATYGGTRSMATRLSTTVWPALSNAISSCSGNASVELLM